MQKHKFQPAERFGVFKAYGGCCLWCGLPLRFRDTTVDHVLAESLAADAGKFAKLKADYGLDDDFSVNDFRNWVPACSSCNSKKSITTYKPVPAFLFILGQIRTRAPLAKKIAEQMHADRRKDAILARLESQIEERTITAEDIRSLLGGLERTPQLMPGREPVFHITGKWRVVEQHGNIALVVTERGGGLTPTNLDPDISWQCPFCSNYGPWNGVRCLSCGHISDPND